MLYLNPDIASSSSVTLTQTEKGFPPEVEHIAVPSYVTNVEKGNNYIIINVYVLIILYHPFQD